MLVLFALTGTAGVSLLVAFLRKRLSLPPRIVAVQKQPGEQLVVLFGESITQGGMSANYVDLLAERMQSEGYRFMNAGVGGDTADNLLNRLRPVVESQPDDIAILVGTNDVQASLRGGYLPALSQSIKKLPQAMTREWYSDTVRHIVQTLQKDARARIALCSIGLSVFF